MSGATPEFLSARNVIAHQPCFPKKRIAMCKEGARFCRRKDIENMVSLWWALVVERIRRWYGSFELQLVTWLNGAGLGVRVYDMHVVAPPLHHVGTLQQD